MAIVVIGSVYNSPSRGRITAPTGQVFVRDTETGAVHPRPAGDLRESPGVPRVTASTRTTPFQGASGVTPGAEEPPVRKFFNIMGDMLKQYQGVRADQLANVQARARGLADERTGAILAETPEDLRRFAPETQAAIRGARAQEGAGEAAAFATGVERQDARAQAFLETFSNFRQLALDMHGEELKKPDTATLNNYKSLIEGGKMDIGDVPADQKKWVIGVLDASKIPEPLDFQEKRARINQILAETGQIGQLKPADLINILDTFGSEEAPLVISELNRQLRQQGNIPLVQNSTGTGYEFGEKTFYGRAHSGTDIMAKAGSAVQAHMPLQVSKVFVGSEGGLQVHGIDPFGATHRFLHLGNSAVKPGQKIDAGAVVGTVGKVKQHSPGELSTGEHVHYDVKDSSGKYVDPRTYAGALNFSTGAPTGTILPKSERELQAKIKQKLQERQIEEMFPEAVAPEDLVKIEIDLADKFEEYVKNPREAMRNIRIMNTSLKKLDQDLAKGKSIGATAQAIITTFNKILDPTSVVREAEYARTPEGASLLERLEGQYTRIKQGGPGVNADLLRQFVATANAFSRGYSQDISSFAERTLRQAERVGAEPQNVLTPDVIKLIEDEAKARQKEDAARQYYQQQQGGSFSPTPSPSPGRTPLRSGQRIDAAPRQFRTFG